MIRYPPPAINADVWWIPRAVGIKPRWILAVNDTHVIYGTGGEKHRECQIKTLLRWIREEKATVTISKRDVQ